MPGPLGALLLSGVALGEVLALLIEDSFAIDNVILNIMLMEAGLALRLVDGPALLGSFPLTNQWSMALLNRLITGHLPVVDEAFLCKVLLAFLLLLGLEVSGVSGVALLGVAMLALNDIIVLSLLNHHNLVNTPLTGSSNGSNVQGNIATSLTGSTSINSLVGMSVLMFVVVIMSSKAGSLAVTLIEWEGSPQVLALPVGTISGGSAGKQGKEGQLKMSKSVINLPNIPQFPLSLNSVIFTFLCSLNHQICWII